jgi:hypothetical protein
MSDIDDDLEQLVRRPPPRDPLPPRQDAGAGVLGRCGCGAQITGADVYGGSGHAYLGRPRRTPAARRYRYRCPLCGRTGELSCDTVS